MENLTPQQRLLPFIKSATRRFAPAYDWVKKVAPEALLKLGKGYSSLAWDLFGDFAVKVKQQEWEPEAWVRDAKSRYAQEWESSGVIEAELMPAAVGGQLAKSEQRLSTALDQAKQGKVDVLAWLKQVRSARATLRTKDLIRPERTGKGDRLRSSNLTIEL